MEDDRPLVTRQETAARLQVSLTKLWQLTARGELRAIRIGRAVRYRPADIEAYISRHRDADALDHRLKAV